LASACSAVFHVQPYLDSAAIQFVFASLRSLHNSQATGEFKFESVNTEFLDDLDCFLISTMSIRHRNQYRVTLLRQSGDLFSAIDSGCRILMNNAGQINQNGDQPMRLSSRIRIPALSILLVLSMLSLPHSESKAASATNNFNPALESSGRQQHEIDLRATDYLTHDNGNFHQYHSNNAQQHTQPRRKPSKGRIEYRSPYNHGSRFRRFHHFPYGRFHSGFYFGHPNRRFFNSIVGGAVLYKLLK